MRLNLILSNKKNCIKNKILIFKHFTTKMWISTFDYQVSLPFTLIHKILNPPTHVSPIMSFIYKTFNSYVPPPHPIVCEPHHKIALLDICHYM